MVFCESVKKARGYEELLETPEGYISTMDRKSPFKEMVNVGLQLPRPRTDCLKTISEYLWLQSNRKN